MVSLSANVFIRHFMEGVNWQKMLQTVAGWLNSQLLATETEAYYYSYSFPQM